MMDRVELADLADQLLEAYRSKLLIDPFFKVSIEVVEGTFHSNCTKDDKVPLSWVVQLNPEKHSDVYDIQYSVVESLIKIIMTPLEGAEKDGIIARLTTAMCNVSLEEESDDVEVEDD